MLRRPAALRKKLSVNQLVKTAMLATRTAFIHDTAKNANRERPHNGASQIQRLEPAVLHAWSVGTTRKTLDFNNGNVPATMTVPSEIVVAQSAPLLRSIQVAIGRDNPNDTAANECRNIKAVFNSVHRIAPRLCHTRPPIEVIPIPIPRSAIMLAVDCIELTMPKSVYSCFDKVRTTIIPATAVNSCTQH